MLTPKTETIINAEIDINMKESVVDIKKKKQKK
jgi:hypothetical protein